MWRKSDGWGVGHCVQNAVVAVCQKATAISEGIVKEPILGSLRVATVTNQNLLIGFPTNTVFTPLIVTAFRLRPVLSWTTSILLGGITGITSILLYVDCLLL